ncbi:MAG: hypothetical protein H6935_12345 [Thiobacillus sp.]|nr:hypothetical protein [Thiobacillus sp.]
MNRQSTLLASVAIALFGQGAWAGGLACKAGYTHVTITEGTAATVNVSETKQVGQLCLTMENDAGRVVFDDCGALIGTVTERDALGNPTKLSHTAVFELLESFKTANDTVLYAVPQSECSFNVAESMTRLKWGTGVFLGGKLNAEATGMVSFCPGQNKNTFEITGEACLRLK